MKNKDDNTLFGQPAIAQIVGKEKGNGQGDEKSNLMR